MDHTAVRESLLKATHLVLSDGTAFDIDNYLFYVSVICQMKVKATEIEIKHHFSLTTEENQYFSDEWIYLGKFYN